MNGSSTSRRLPDSWVQRIFSSMQGHYGTRWLNMWRIGQTLPDGQDAGVVNAMEVWAVKLGGWNSEVGGRAIGRALQNLPPEPPTLPQFNDLVRLAYTHVEVPKVSYTPSEAELEHNRVRIQEIIRTLTKRNGVSA